VCCECLCNLKSIIIYFSRVQCNEGVRAEDTSSAKYSVRRNTFMANDLFVHGVFLQCLEILSNTFQYLVIILFLTNLIIEG
jgi:hypothetical protein